MEPDLSGFARRLRPRSTCTWQTAILVASAFVSGVVWDSSYGASTFGAQSRSQGFRSGAHLELEKGRSPLETPGKGVSQEVLPSLRSEAWDASSVPGLAAGDLAGIRIPFPDVTDPSCDNILDPLWQMVREKRWVIFVFTLVSIPGLVLLLMVGGFFVGRHIKPRPPKYWKSRRRHLFHDDFDIEVDVTDTVGPAIQALLNCTTKPGAMGKGRDGSWVTHRGFRVIRVTRVEHGKLYTRYKQIRRSMRTNVMTLAMMPPELRSRTEAALSSIERIHLERELDPLVYSFMRGLNLDVSRNERILFHGCPGAGARDDRGEVLFPTEAQSPMYAVKRQGFDDRLGNVKGMYGSGTYFADMSSKADQYAGRYNPNMHPDGSVGEHATMFLARVTLGCPYLTDQSLEQLQRPPCIHGHFDLKLSWNDDVLIGKPWKEKGVEFQICDHARFDSVLGDLVIEGSRKLYREYVVYENQCYPEFCVTYERVAGARTGTTSVS